MPHTISSNDIFKQHSSRDFDALALEVFSYQSQYIPIYRNYLKQLNILPASVNNVAEIPMLPIEFFKSHEVKNPEQPTEIVFSSSGTSSSIQSMHYVSSLDLYKESFLKGFEHFYENPEQYCILGLLPAYLERTGSSLIYMVNELIQKSKNPKSGFFLNNLGELANALQQNEKDGIKSLLIGVTFALLDFADEFPMELKNTIVMETGGMKGRREEMIREEVHSHIKKAFSLDRVHSEYGMTELLSQAYSSGKGLFSCPPWMKVSIRDAYDPMTTMPQGKAGGINLIDLANVNSCSFIATSDLGRICAPNQFEVLGRFDQSEMRGCNLLVV